PHTTSLSVLLAMHLPLRSPLSPYTTLFRSSSDRPGANRLAAQKTLQVVGQGLRTCVTPARLLLQALQADGFQILRDRALQARGRSEEHTSELQSLTNLVCRLLLEKKKSVHR